MISLETTIAIMAAAAALFLGATLLSRRDYMPGRPPLVPYGVVQFISLVVFFVMAAHLITLLTGVPLEPRRRF